MTMIRRTTDATVEPVTLAEAKLHLRETLVSTDNDTYIESLITAARLACEEAIQRTLITTTWTLTLDGFPDAIRLPYPQIIAVSSVSYIDEAGDTQTLDPQDYIVDTKSEPGFIVPAVDVTWPTTQDRINAVTVVYTAGYGASATSVPKTIKHWIKLAVSDLYDNRGLSADRTVPQDFARSLIDPYRVYG